MEVRVDTFMESLEGIRTLVNTAYLVFVALDDQNRPIPVSYTHLDVYKRQVMQQAGILDLIQGHILITL